MINLVDNLTGKIAKPETLFEVERKEDILIFNFVAKSSSLESYSDIDNDDLWRLNVVEVFLDTGEDYYYEFEVAPNGAIFVAKINNGQITFVDHRFFKAKVSKEADTYMVTMTIDLSNIPIKDSLKFNAFRTEVIDGKQILEALNPTYCDTFHKRDKFVELK